MAKRDRSRGVELCLDFANTVDWRNGDKREDGLENFGSLVDWGVKKGIIVQEEGAAILKGAKEGRREESALRKAVELRETIYTIFSSVAHDEPPVDEDLDTLNRFLSDYPVSSSVVKAGLGYGLVMVPIRGAEGRILWPVAKSAADLLTSDQLGRVNECANEEEGCGWVFIDKTRSGTKKWCSSAGCGNRAKVRAWYNRHERTG